MQKPVSLSADLMRLAEHTQTLSDDAKRLMKNKLDPVVLELIGAQVAELAGRALLMESQLAEAERRLATAPTIPSMPAVRLGAQTLSGMQPAPSPIRFPNAQAVIDELEVLDLDAAAARLERATIHWRRGAQP